MWFIRTHITRLARFIRRSIEIWFDEHIAAPVKKVVHSKPFIGAMMLVIGVTWTWVITVSQYEGADTLRFARESFADAVRPAVALEFINPALASTTPEVPEKIIAEPVKQITPAEIEPIIYRLESSEGKKDGCRAKGLYNGYGYAQNANVWMCYESREEVKKLVLEWFTDALKTKTVAEAVCGYNLGYQSEHFGECVNGSAEYHYYRDFQMFSKK